MNTRGHNPEYREAGNKPTQGAEPVRPRRVLFVFAWLVVGGEETEVRLLARHLDRARYRIDVVACQRRAGMPTQTHEQLAALGIDVDQTPYTLSFAETVAYLAEKMADYDVIVACQAVPDVYPALERMAHPPPLIEHGGLVVEAHAGPRHLTHRYVGVCDSIRAAAAAAMPGREAHALEIPSMVDLSEFDPADRPAVRRELAVPNDAVVIGWVGRLDRKKRVEDVIAAAALVLPQRPHARFVIIGGPDAFMPEYADDLRARVTRLGIGHAVQFLGDRPDVPRLLSGLDIFLWLSRDEGMPHVISEAGAASLPVIATLDNGSAEQIEAGVSGLFVPHQSPTVVAATLTHLIDTPADRARLGIALRATVEHHYSAAAVTRQWEALFDEVVAERASWSHHHIKDAEGEPV